MAGVKTTLFFIAVVGCGMLKEEKAAAEAAEVAEKAAAESADTAAVEAEEE